jgi:hypothetical protein
MISASAEIFGPFVRSISWFYDTWTKQGLEKRRLRREIYDKEFAPAFERMAEIHKDYIKTFDEFVGVCREMATPNPDLINKFRTYGLEYSHWREGIKSFSDTGRALSKHFRRVEEKEAINEFVSAITEYFHVTVFGTVYNSWFSAFMDTFERQVRSGRSPWDYDYNSIISSGDNVSRSFVSQLEHAYRVELPKRWKRVCAAKDRVRAVFCVPA